MYHRAAASNIVSEICLAPERRAPKPILKSVKIIEVFEEK